MRLCGMGIPMGLQYSITAIGSVVLQAAVNTLGTMSVAAVAAAEKLVVIFCCPFDALGSAIATYAGQNVGAGKPGRVQSGHKMLYAAGIGLCPAGLAPVLSAWRQSGYVVRRYRPMGI